MYSKSRLGENLALLTSGPALSDPLGLISIDTPLSSKNPSEPIRMEGDDYAGDSTTTGVLDANGSVLTATITPDPSTQSDMDWFKIDLVEDQGILVSVDFISGNLDYMRLGLIDSSGIDYGSYVIGSGSSNEVTLGLRELFNPDPSQPLEFFLFFESAFNQSGSYTINVSEVADDYGISSFDRGSVILDGAPTTGQSNFDNDKDSFLIMIDSPGYIDFTLNYNEATGPVEASILNLEGDALWVLSPTGNPGQSTISLNLTQTGFYVIQVSSSLFGTTTPSEYTLSAVTSDDPPPPPEDDYAGDATTTGMLAPNTFLDATHEDETDSDWFAIEAIEGRTYTITVNTYALMTLRNADGTEYADFEVTGDPNIGAEAFTLTFTANATETLYLDVTARANPDEALPTEFPENYRIEMTGNPLDDAVPLADGQTFNGIIAPSSQAIFRFDVEAGETVLFSFDTIRAFDINFRITDTDDAFVGSFGDASPLGMEYTFTDAGTYFLRLDFGNAVSEGSEYALTRIDNPQDVGGVDNPANLALDGAILNKFSSTDDVDAFEFTVEAGQSVELILNGLPVSVPLLLLDTDGNDVTARLTRRDFETGVGTPWALSSATGETFRLVLDPSTASPNTNYYKLSLRADPDRHLDSIETNSVLTTNEAQTGTINYRLDQDWFAFDVSGAQGYEFQIQWNPNLASDDQAPSLAFYDAQGQAITTFLSYVPNEVGQQTLLVGGLSDGQYFVSVSDFNQTQSQSLDYTLTAEALPDDFGATAETAGVFTNGRAIGQLNFLGDSDWLAIDVTAGEKVAIFADLPDAIASRAILHNVDGTTRNLDQNDAFLFLNASQTGTAYVEIISDGDFGDRLIYPADYELNYERITDNVPDSRDTAMLLNPGDVVRDSLTIGDQDWFKIEAQAGDVLQLAFGGADWVGIFDIVLSNADGSQTITSNEGVYEILVTGTYFAQVVNFGATETDTDLTQNNDRYVDYTIGLVDADNLIYAFSGIEDNFILTDADEVAYGLRGNDAINGLGGSDHIFGDQGEDQLFGDSTITLSKDSLEGQLFRAYQAVFDRAPDAGGFKAFLTEMRLGNLDQAAIIAQLVASTEFVNSYGDLDNRAFVEQLYRNVLDREGEETGVTNFTNALNDGTLTRTEVVLELANSNEFINLMIIPSASFATNVIIHPAEAQVFRIYKAVFDRAPDEGGFTNFVNSIQGNVLSVDQITAEFVASPEFQATYGALDDAGFVELLFSTVLPGNTDQQGRADFTEALGNGTLTRAAMVAEFVESFEFIQAQAQAAQDFVASTYSTSGDILEGGSGNDNLFGGRGVDTFVVNPTDTDHDVILDFVLGTDRLIITDASFDEFSELMAVASQSGQDTIFDFGNGNSLTLQNVVLTDIEAGNLGLSSAVAQDYDPSLDGYWDLFA